MGLKQLYISEARNEINQFRSDEKKTIEEKDIKHLPEPVQRYFRNCGYIGKEYMTNAQIIWEQAFLRTAPEKSWMKIGCYQFNSVPEPCRIVYMKNNINGFVPFEGRDIYQNGNGNMLIKLAKIFTIADDKSREMDKSALVTVMAEALLLPTYTLQKYASWQPIDDNSAECTFEFNDTKVTGTFYFNENGENTNFITNDRYRSERGQNKTVKWSAVSTEYIEKNGIRYPSEVSAVWLGENSVFEYFRGKISDIVYNVNDII